MTREAVELREQAAGYSIIGTDMNGEKEIAISQKARLQNTYLIGATGTGKSSLLARLILQDIHAGVGGLCVIEPSGDLIHMVLAGIPEERIKDVLLLDMTESEYPFGLNMFECSNPQNINEVGRTASMVCHVFERVWGIGPHTPRLSHVLRSVTHTLIDNPGTCFSEIPLLFWDEAVRERAVANLTNSQARLFWQRFGQMSGRERREYVESTDNKVDAYLASDMVRHIVSQSKTTVDFRAVMDSGKILLVKLSPQFEEAGRLIGTLIIGKLLMAAFSREDVPEGERKMFHLYCDEYQRFATSDFAQLIQEAGRKFRVPVTLAHQSLAQLDEGNRAAAMGAGTMIVFRVTGEDGKELAKCFDTTPEPMVSGEEPVRAPVSDVISHLVRRGHNDARVTRFAQGYLQHLESFIQKKYDIYPPQEGMFQYIYLTAGNILRGRELLNDCLYRSMDTKSADCLIPPLALYLLAIAKRDGTKEILERFVKTDSWVPLPPRYFDGFKETASVFGHPDFVRKEYVDKFLSGLRRNDKAIGAAMVAMIQELRYTMEALAASPILVDTGQYKPKYQNRAYADMENEIARDLAQQPNFQAKVKLLNGEQDIRTSGAPLGLTGRDLTARIHEIKAQMRTRGYCRHYTEVEREICERQRRWRGRTEELTETQAARRSNAAGQTDRGTQSESEPPPFHY